MVGKYTKVADTSNDGKNRQRIFFNKVPVTQWSECLPHKKVVLVQNPVRDTNLYRTKMNYKNAVVKFNNGNGALLCNKCRYIISYSFNHEDKKHYCERCKSDNKEDR